MYFLLQIIELDLISCKYRKMCENCFVHTVYEQMNAFYGFVLWLNLELYYFCYTPKGYL